MNRQPRVERRIVTLEQPGQQRIHPEKTPLTLNPAQHHAPSIPNTKHDETRTESRALPAVNPPTFSAAT